MGRMIVNMRRLSWSYPPNDFSGCACAAVSRPIDAALRAANGVA
ncbi:MAG: hypothetical protein AVDCRST_MAG42-960 [uncultured Chthoniobacterales bacterium]|uniref:Uncharacterized protein n=1 Tax=uncultured Chthoniobacterales bacterium TaxID=1836801 RepID=A0A6J4HMM4_9BACT|nr:MAG: hypothetical protein AVDCRST_MAG42-960 [uncultured Chthoniobacterales bacterium]